MKLYTVYDRASEQYNVPFTQLTDAAAIRMVQAEMQAPDSMLAKFPTDYELYEIGTLDFQTGIIDITTRHRVARLEDIKAAILIQPLYPEQPTTDQHHLNGQGPYEQTR